MKILLVNTFYYPDISGGAEISVQKLAEGLIDKGHKVFVLVTGEHDCVENINGVKIIRFRTRNLYNTINVKKVKGLTKLIYKVIDLYNIFNYSKLNKIIKSINPEIIHTNNMYGISPIIWDIAHKNKIRVIHTIRDYNLLCPNVNCLCEMSKCKIAKICGFYKGYMRKISKKIDSIVFISDSVRKRFIDYNYFEKSKKYIVYNAIDYKKDSVDKKIIYKQNKKEKVINLVFIGTLEKHKGIDLLLEAFSSYQNKNIRLHIAGKGGLEYLIKEYTEKDKRIKYYGFILQNEIEKFLDQFDVLVAPSIWSEPFGRVVIDAYKSAMPVIASRNGGLSETVINNKTGILIENVNKENLVNAFKKISNRKIIKFFLNNIDLELEKYSLDTHVSNYLNIYRNEE